MSISCFEIPKAQGSNQIADPIHRARLLQFKASNAFARLADSMHVRRHRPATLTGSATTPVHQSIDEEDVRLGVGPL